MIYTTLNKERRKNLGCANDRYFNNENGEP